MNNIMGVVWSLVFVFVIIGISTLLSTLKVLNEEGSRKFVHIGVGHWWILAMIFFNNVWWAIVPPVIFIVLNYISYKQKVFKAMERSEAGDFGTVTYPISLLILVLATFFDPTTIEVLGVNVPQYAYIGAIGIFVMAYGDGFAAVIGKRFGKTKLINRKSLEGSLTMFVFSFAVTALILALFDASNVWLGSALVALVATGLELVSPKGIDNLAVPLGASLIYYLVFLVLL